MHYIGEHLVPTRGPDIAFHPSHFRRLDRRQCTVHPPHPHPLSPLHPVTHSVAPLPAPQCASRVESITQLRTLSGSNAVRPGSSSRRRARGFSKAPSESGERALKEVDGSITQSWSLAHRNTLTPEVTPKSWQRWRREEDTNRPPTSFPGSSRYGIQNGSETAANTSVNGWSAPSADQGACRLWLRDWEDPGKQGKQIVR